EDFASPDLLDNRHWFSLRRGGYSLPSLKSLELASERVTLRIGGSPVSHGAGVDIGIVVGPQRGDPPPRGSEILPPPAQVAGRGQRGIVDVVDVDLAVVVGVDAVLPPRLRDELHGSHRPHGV